MLIHHCQLFYNALNAPSFRQLIYLGLFIVKCQWFVRLVTVTAIFLPILLIFSLVSSLTLIMKRTFDEMVCSKNQIFSSLFTDEPYMGN